MDVGSVKPFTPLIPTQDGGQEPVCGAHGRGSSWLPKAAAAVALLVRPPVCLTCPLSLKG